MQYVIAFLEGIITFISPCLLPMLPVYLSYFVNGENDKRNTFRNALGFVLGFTLVFVSLGAFASGIGRLLKQHTTEVNLITGGIVILFGLNFMGVLRLPFLNKTKKADVKITHTGFFSAVLFGIVFSIGWTPCVGAFLGSALMMASQSNTMGQGITMLILYSIGLGIPFLVSALVLDQLKGTFQFIKKHYKVINTVSGLFLVVVGILMMTGSMGYLLSLLSF